MTFACKAASPEQRRGERGTTGLETHSTSSAVPPMRNDAAPRLSGLKK